MWVNLLDLIYPVGSVYIIEQNDDNTPVSLFGGTWTQINLNSNATGFDWYVRIA